MIRRVRSSKCGHAGRNLRFKSDTLFTMQKHSPTHLYSIPLFIYSALPETSRLPKTAEYGPPVSEDHLYRVVDAIDKIAAETGKSVPQIALNWLLQRPTVSTVIIGARNEEQLKQNLGAVGWSLTTDQMQRLNAASEVTPAYPYWHQRQFAERNPWPV
jgi:diketogulonate reductase-like aldo/keto reductase